MHQRPDIPGYEIQGELGRGGMGVVYRARQTKLNRTVALKMILAGEHAGPEQVRRFLAEAEACARLQHPNIVQVFHIDEYGGRPYLEMEFVPGGNLARSLDGTPQPPGSAAKLVETLAGAIAEAHRAGVVHRDLKPGNILLTADGQPKVADFGLAKLLDTDSGATRTDSVIGSPSYMAPEQAEGRAKAIGPAADVYALGVILYEMLVGRPPFRGATVLDTLQQVRTSEPVPPSRLVAGLPRDLETICLKCLQKEPARRYQSADALADDLRRSRAGEPISARPAGRLERGWRWSRRNPVVAGSLAAAALAIVAVVAVSIAFASVQAKESERGRRLLKESNRRLAALGFEQAQAAFDRWETGEGLTRLVQSWRSGVAADDPAWTRVARVSLANWQRVHPVTEQFFVHGDVVTAVAFSPDGKVILTASLDRTARLWDAATGEPLGRPMLHPDRVTSAAFSTDGKAIITESSIGRIWDATTGEPLGPPIGDRPKFGPDGKAAVTRTAAVGRLWDPRTGRQIGADLKHGGEIASAAFSPDGRTVVTCSDDGTAKLWEAANGRPLAVLRHDDKVLVAAFSPDGKTVVTGSEDRTARFWEAATGRPLDSTPLRRIRGAVSGEPAGRYLSHGAAVHFLAYSPDGKTVVTGGYSSLARRWDAATGRPMGDAMGTDLASGLAFSPDGQAIINTSVIYRPRLWDVRDGRPIGLHTWDSEDLPLLEGGVGHSFAFRPDGKAVVIPELDQAARVWDTTYGQPVGSPLRHEDGVYAVAYSPNGDRILTGGGDGTARLWNVATGHAAAIPLDRPVAFRPDGKGVVVGEGGMRARHRDLATGRPIGPPLVLGGAGETAAFSPDSRTLITSRRDRAQLWDAATGRPVGPPLPTGYVAFMAFSPDSTILLASERDKFRLWDAATGRPLGPPSVPGGDLTALAFRPDGKTFLTISSLSGPEGEGGRRSPELSHRIQAWSSASGRPLGPPLIGAGAGDVAAFSPDRTIALVASGPKTAQLRDMASGKPIGQPMVHLDRIQSVAFSPDGKVVITGSRDRTARLWDSATGRPIGPHLRHQREVACVAFSPDGKLALTAGHFQVRLWDVATGMPSGPPLVSPNSILGPVGFSPDGRFVVASDMPDKALLWPIAETSDDPDLAATRIEALTGLTLDPSGSVVRLERRAWLRRRATAKPLDPSPVPGWLLR